MVYNTHISSVFSFVYLFVPIMFSANLFVFFFLNLFLLKRRWRERNESLQRNNDMRVSKMAFISGRFATIFPFHFQFLYYHYYGLSDIKMVSLVGRYFRTLVKNIDLNSSF